MEVVTTRAELAAARTAHGELGLIPTMGYLHAGHLSLVAAARRENAAVAASVFVNPTQFGPGEDLQAYPRDLQRDLALLADAGTDLVWVPRTQDVYPAGFATTVTVAGLTDRLEGAHRHGHFAGVCTVVAILLGAVCPTRAYFGRKDAQQAVVVQRMATDLALGAQIRVAPIVREPDGLALSSRNVYLDAQQRRASRVLSASLRAARRAYADGERDGERLRAVVAEVLAGEPCARPDYVSVADPQTFAELDRVAERGALVSLAVRIGRVRLLDNTVLDTPPGGDDAGLDAPPAAG